MTPAEDILNHLPPWERPGHERLDSPDILEIVSEAEWRERRVHNREARRQRALEYEADQQRVPRAEFEAKWEHGHRGWLRRADSIEELIRILPIYAARVERWMTMNSLRDFKGGVLTEGALIRLNALCSFGRPGSIYHDPDEYNVRLVVEENQSGASIEAISSDPDALEVIMPQDTAYRVMSIVDLTALPVDDPNYWPPDRKATPASGRKVSGGWLVYLEEID